MVVKNYFLLGLVLSLLAVFSACSLKCSRCAVDCTDSVPMNDSIIVTYHHEGLEDFIPIHVAPDLIPQGTTLTLRCEAVRDYDYDYSYFFSDAATYLFTAGLVFKTHDEGTCIVRVFDHRNVLVKTYSEFYTTRKTDWNLLGILRLPFFVLSGSFDPDKKMRTAGFNALFKQFKEDLISDIAHQVYDDYCVPSIPTKDSDAIVVIPSL